MEESQTNHILPSSVKAQIIERLAPLGVEKVILFGSYAYGEPDDESDIDLYVVTKDENLPANFREKNELYMKVSRLLQDLRKRFAIDLIVHSKKMHELFRESDNSFFKNEISRGIRLL